MITTRLSFIFVLLWFKNEITTQAGLSCFGQNLGKTLYNYLINLEIKGVRIGSNGETLSKFR
jgi:hypothetical protein